jgi:hypothetical protein
VEVQTHGYEVDLVGARADRLVLANMSGECGNGVNRNVRAPGQSGSIAWLILSTRL